jgi:uncharacterized membrane protein (DUF485 family)
MKLFEKMSNRKYERQKRKQEKELQKFNSRQEELDLKYKQEKQKSDFKSLLSKLKFETYTKRIVGLIVFVCLVDLQLSYALAFMGKEQIAESLSIQICTTILGTVIVYLIRAYFDTKAEKNEALIKSGLIVNKDSKIIPDELIKNKINEVINNSGLAEHINNEGKNTTLETENPDDSESCG